jgi:putative membrane protein
MTKSRALTITLLIVGVFVLLSGISLAQQDANMNGNSNANTSRAANANANQGMMAKSADAKFMMTAGEGGMAEVALARLALERASSDAVKQYAQRMVDDHTKAGEELMQLASTKGITLPTGPDAKHMALIEKLRQKSGAEFDRMYVKEAGVKAHESMEKLFQKESTGGKDADAKAFAAKTLPTVQEHLRMARDMSASMMNTSANANTGANTSGNMNGNSNGNMNGNSNRNKNRNGNMNGNGNANTSNGNMNP